MHKNPAEPADSGGGKGLAIVVGAAALLRLAYLLDYRAHGVFWDAMLLDAQVYDRWALQIAAGDWLGGPDVYALPPLYAYALAFCFGIFGHSYAAVYVVQSLLGLVNIGLVHAIARKVYGQPAALIAAALAALYGPFMFWESKLMGTTLALTLGLGLVWLLLHAAEARKLWLWSVCGAVLGLTALVRPETLLFLPLAAWWISRTGLAARDGAGPRPWLAVALFTCFALIAISPVAVRNALRAGEWSPANLVSSQAGITFYQANNPRANGLYTRLSGEGFSGRSVSQAEEERAVAERELGRPLKRSEVTRYWMRRGWAWIFANPKDFLALELKKLRRFVGSYEYSSEYLISVERESVRTLWLAALPFAAVTALALAGIAGQVRAKFTPPALLLALFAATNFVVVMAFYVSSRYRMASVPVLIVFAAATVARLWQGMRSHQRSARGKAWVGLVAVVVLFLAFTIRVDDRHVVQEAWLHANMGNKYLNRKRYLEALGEYDRALRTTPNHAAAWYTRGRALQGLGRTSEAVASFREALRWNDGMAEARQAIVELGGTP